MIMIRQFQIASLGCILLGGYVISRADPHQIRPVVDLPTGQLYIVLVGDTSFGENYQEKIEKRGGENILKSKGYEYSFKNFAQLLRQANLVIANLETPLTDLVSSPLEGRKSYIHWSDPHNAPIALKQHNIRAVSLANNHTLDYGIPGLEQSLNALTQNSIQWFGAGRNEYTAIQPLRIDYLLAGQPFRIVIAAGFEYRQKYDKRYEFYAKGNKGGVNAWTMDRAIKQMRAVCWTNPDALVVAYPHFGRNYTWKMKWQTRLAQALIDAGADIVIGHGAHMFQEVEQYQGRWIIYSLGNFVFNSPGRYQMKKVDPFSLIARLDIMERQDATSVILRLYPIISDNLTMNYQPYFVSDEQFRRAQKLLLQHSLNAEHLRTHMRIGEDEFGKYFTLNVTPGVKSKGYPFEQRLPSDSEDATE